MKQKVFNGKLLPVPSTHRILKTLLRTAWTKTIATVPNVSLSLSPCGADWVNSGFDLGWTRWTAMSDLGMVGVQYGIHWCTWMRRDADESDAPTRSITYSSIHKYVDKYRCRCIKNLGYETGTPEKVMQRHADSCSFMHIDKTVWVDPRRYLSATESKHASVCICRRSGWVRIFAGQCGVGFHWGCTLTRINSLFSDMEGNRLDYCLEQKAENMCVIVNTIH